jgi:predicted Ser/Thr protein kinase
MPNQLPVLPGGVEIDLSSIDANPFQSAPLKYRLLPGDTKWTESQDGRIKLNGLSPGSYKIEAAYTGEGPAPLLQWRFQLTDSAARSRNAFFLCSLSVLVGFIWWRWQFLQYWFTKPLFLLGRSIHRNDPQAVPPETVSWTNYSGHTFAKRYRLAQPLARGGFSVAYLADDQQTQAKVVVKVLHRAPGQEGWNRDRFAHEVAALHTVRHPGVVHLLDSWISGEGEPCLAMEYIEGPTLRQLLDAQGSLKPDRAARLIEQLGAALAAVHAPGIVHRDFKPENIIIRSAGTISEHAVIIDFGTSAARGPERDLERTVTLTGSLHYLAPERLTNRYSPASDLYSFGVIILEVLTGKRPADFAASAVDPNFKVLLAAQLGEGLATEIARALHPDPAERPEDPAAWASVCASFLRNGN